MSDYGPPGPLSPELEAKLRIERGVWKDRAEAAEKALADTIARVQRLLEQRDDLRAELEKMKSDRDQFADEADSLRAKLEEARAVVGRVATERDDLRAKLAQCEKDWDEEVTDAEAKLAAAEEQNSKQALSAIHWRNEADAALARVRELEAGYPAHALEVATHMKEVCDRDHEKEREYKSQQDQILGGKLQTTEARVTQLEEALRELLPFVTNRGRMDYREAAFEHARRVLEEKP